MIVPDYFYSHEELVGVCVGRCILLKGWPKPKRLKDHDGKPVKDKDGKYIREFPHAAHAHTHGPGQGFICFRSTKDFEKETTCKHELAHIITREGHTKRWAEKYVELVSTTPKLAKWLTVEWLQKKYGFDEENEGNNLLQGLLKHHGL